MKLLEQRNIVKVSEGLQTTAFKLQMSSKMSQILSDGIYSDKIKAVIRELSTNAYDSHIAAGKKSIPIEITLPSTWSSNFIVEDFGVGLSPEQVENVYTVYGASDKDNSNEMVGALGLGAKTIFCYGTKTASIESVVDRVKYSYSAYVNEQGMPVLSKLGENSTNQPNGVKITIPVNRTDISNFLYKAKEIYSVFETKPIIKGSTISYDKPNIIVHGTGWELREYGEAHGIMGSVSYPLKWSDTSLTSQETKMMNHPFYLQFPIGELDVEVSREGLQYNVRTKSNIIAKFKLIRAELATKFQAEIDKCTTLWDARLLGLTKHGVLYEYVDKSKLEWKGKKLFQGINYGNELLLPEKIQRYDHYYSSRSKFQPKDCEDVVINSNIIFIKNDLDKGLDSRAHLYNQTHNPYRIYVITALQEQMIIDTLGFDPAKYILPASTLPKPIPKARVITGTGVKRGNTHSIMELQQGGQTLTSYYKNVQKDFDDGGFYVEFNTFKCEHNGTSYHPKAVLQLLNSLETCGIKREEVFAIKTAKIPKLVKAAKPWTEYLGYALDQMDKAYANIGYTPSSLQAVQKTLDGFGGYNYTVGCRTLSIDNILKLKPLVKQTDFLDFVKELEELIKIKEFNNVRRAVEALYNIIGRKLPTFSGTQKDVTKECTSCLDAYKKLNTKYVFLELFASHSSDNYGELAIYMNAK